MPAAALRRAIYDIEGIELTLAPPERISGRVILPESRPISAGYVVSLGQRENRIFRQQSLLKATFHSELRPTGDCNVRTGTTGRTDDLYLSAIRMGDEDVLAKGFYLGGAAPASLEIVLAANGGALQASVANKKGDPIPEGHVILLPDPPRRAQRAVRRDSTTDASGGCNICGIAPGDYHAFAFRDNSPFDVDETTIKEIEKYAQSVTITAGGQPQLKLEPVPDDE
jgi:hypothetical protein